MRQLLCAAAAIFAPQLIDAADLTDAPAAQAIRSAKPVLHSPPILDDPRFGDVLRPRLLLREGYTQFNHGSFGTVPRDVMAELHRLQEQCEDDPDAWIGTGYRALVQEARGVLARADSSRAGRAS